MAPDRNRHMDEEELDHYTMSDIPEEECARVEEHLLVCEACRQRVTAGDRYVHAMRDAAGVLRSEPRVERHWGWFWPRLVPALLAVALLALVAWRVGPALEIRNPAIAVSLAAVRGSNPAAKAPAGKTLDMRLDLSALPVFDTYRVELVDAVGSRVWQGAATIASPACRIDPLRAGAYFVRVSSPAGELLREYALETSAK